MMLNFTFKYLNNYIYNIYINTHIHTNEYILKEFPALYIEKAELQTHINMIHPLMFIKVAII